MLHSHVTIDLTALEHNIALVQRRLPKDARLIFVVKADAYGHGIERVAQTAQAAGVDMLGASTVEEGAKIRAAGVTVPILLLAPILPTEARTAVSLDLTLPISDLTMARLLDRTAHTLHTVAHTHVVVDTGMHRFGILTEAVPALIHELRPLAALRVDGIYSHFATAVATDESDRSFCTEQLTSFQQLLAVLADRHLTPPICHIANSAAFIDREANVLTEGLNGVRIGTLLYGYPEVRRAWVDAIEPVATLSAPVIAIKDLQPGDGVGYGRTYCASKKETIAVIPIGYSTGINPLIANRGSVWVGGRIAPVVGAIGLNHMMIDITNINLSIGDEVEIFGPHLYADRLAAAVGIGVWKLVVPALQHAGKRIYV